jgi:putative membrane protein
MQLSDQVKERLAARVALLEARTGAQVVTVLAARSDSYPEAPWKAFSLGAALAALAIAACSAVAHQWETGVAALHGVAAVLGCGALFALLTLWCPPLARLFTDRLRRRVEVGQHARALFFDRGLDRTRGRIGILLLASAFEREVVLLADDGFDGKVAHAQWQELTQRVTLLLRHDGAAGALQAALDGLEALLLAQGFNGGDAGNALPNAVIVQAGRP